MMPQLANYHYTSAEKFKEVIIIQIIVANWKVQLEQMEQNHLWTLAHPCYSLIIDTIMTVKIFLLQHFSIKVITAVSNINLQLFNDKLIRVKGGYP